MNTTKKIAVITGANRGIGRATIEALVSDSSEWIVLGAARDLASMDYAKGFEGKILPVQLDITSNGSCQELANFIMKQYDRLDLLINNAGIMTNAPMLEFNLEEIATVMETNFYGAMRLTKYLMPLLRNSSDPRIINVSSEMGRTDEMTGGYAAYRLSKWALNGFTMLLDGELKHSNIKVNAVCPGWCQTDMGGQGAVRTAESGADVIIWAATAPNIPRGKFISNMHVVEW